MPSSPRRRLERAEGRQLQAKADVGSLDRSAGSLWLRGREAVEKFLVEASPCRSGVGRRAVDAVAPIAFYLEGAGEDVELGVEVGEAVNGLGMLREPVGSRVGSLPRSAVLVSIVAIVDSSSTRCGAVRCSRRSPAWSSRTSACLMARFASRTSPRDRDREFERHTASWRTLAVSMMTVTTSPTLVPVQRPVPVARSASAWRPPRAVGCPSRRSRRVVSSVSGCEAGVDPSA